jgi:hypothetical protein
MGPRALSGSLTTRARRAIELVLALWLTGSSLPDGMLELGFTSARPTAPAETHDISEKAHGLLEPLSAHPQPS